MKRIERGWAGHFIAGNSCYYHRNTLLDFGKKKIVVSTIGNYHGADEKLDTIGLERHYETMVFEAKKEGEYWEADVEKPISFDSNWAIKVTKENEDDVDNEADKMHEAVVKEIIKKYGVKA